MDISLLSIDLIDLIDSEAIAARCTGQNARRTLLVFQAQENAAELHAFLAKVLAAAQLDAPKDTLSLSVTTTEQFSFAQLCQFFDIQSLIAFGVAPARLGIHFQLQPYDILRYDGRTYVFADDLQAIYEERQQGGKRMSGELWKVLQQLFLK